MKSYKFFFVRLISNYVIQIWLWHRGFNGKLHIIVQNYSPWDIWAKCVAHKNHMTYIFHDILHTPPHAWSNGYFKI